ARRVFPSTLKPAPACSMLNAFLECLSAACNSFRTRSAKGYLVCSWVNASRAFSICETNSLTCSTSRLAPADKLLAVENTSLILEAPEIILRLALFELVALEVVVVAGKGWLVMTDCCAPTRQAMYL